MHSQIIEQSNVQDLVNYILDERWDLVERHRDVQNGLMSEILSEGNRTGEFNVADVDQTANAIYAMTTKFRLASLYQKRNFRGAGAGSKRGCGPDDPWTERIALAVLARSLGGIPLMKKGFNFRNPGYPIRY